MVALSLVRQPGFLGGFARVCSHTDPIFGDRSIRTIIDALAPFNSLASVLAAVSTVCLPAEGGVVFFVEM